MSLEFIGLIGPHESSESQAPRGPQVDLGFIKAFAQARSTPASTRPCWR